MEGKKHNKLRMGLSESLSRQMRFAQEAERIEILRRIEEDLPGLLGSLEVEVNSIYELTSASTIRDLRNRIATSPQAQALDNAAHGQLGIAMKLYANFLDSKFNPLKKKPKRVKTHVQEEKTEEKVFVEGAKVQQTVDRRERNLRARQECIEKKGCKCIVCGFDFETVYGPAGKGYVEVHHLKPISLTDDEHEVSADDLVPLCANCHAMAHRRSPEPFSPKDLLDMLNAQRK